MGVMGKMMGSGTGSQVTATHLVRQQATDSRQQAADSRYNTIWQIGNVE